MDKEWSMVRALPWFLVAGLLAGCAGKPVAEEVEGDSPTQPLQLSCYQAGWQAETVPVIYKRGGQEVWDRYEFMPRATGGIGCL
ncbi:Lipoprotein [Pseudomonas coronafaciens pv. oryzae]|nr:Lipoprotein [Pseudomonas coronafaciens pv. oryzae]RMN27100.1 Lipoprotein [Pseudomonas coronafaciens pv. zizaniae]